MSACTACTPVGFLYPVRATTSLSSREASSTCVDRLHMVRSSFWDAEAVPLFSPLPPPVKGPEIRGRQPGTCAAVAGSRQTLREVL